MWSIYPYLTVGVEYAYGRLTFRDDTRLANHRIGLALQVF